MPTIYLAAKSVLGSAVRKAGLALFRFLVGLDGTPRSYRPEAHYMRGPGPKWREKHALDDSGRG
jgi:hypothetical protein